MHSVRFIRFDDGDEVYAYVSNVYVFHIQHVENEVLWSNNEH